MSCGSRDSKVISIRVISASGGETARWHAGQCLTTSSVAAFTHLCGVNTPNTVKATSLRSLNPNWGEKLSKLTSVVMAGWPGEEQRWKMALGFKVRDSLEHCCRQGGTGYATLSADVTLAPSPWAPPSSQVLPSSILSYPFFCHLSPRKACCLTVNRPNLTFPSP